MTKLATYLENKIWYMLLFTVAVIPLEQEFTSFCVGVTFICAAIVAHVRGRGSQPCVLRPWQQGALYVLLAISAASIYFSMDRFLSFWNWVYVVGQYAALVFVLLRYASVVDSEKCAVADIEQNACCTKQLSMQEKLLLLWQRFCCLPRPLQLIGAFLGVSLLVSMIGLAQKIFGVTAEGIWVDPKQFPDIKVRVFSTLVNPNILAGYLVLVIAYSTAFFNQTKAYKKWRLAFLVTGLLAALCLLYTYSRGNWVACAVMLLAFCVLFCRKAFIPILGGGAAVLATGGTAVLHRLASIQGGYGGDTSIALRMAYLKSTKWIIEEFPLGVGWYGYRFVYPTYNFYLADKSVIMYHCHNIFLNIWAELGAHGLLAFLVVWWGIFLPASWRLAYHGRSLWLKAMGRGYVLATVGIIVGGLTDHVYFNTQMGLCFWTLGGLTMLCKKLNEEDD
ncbi:O-antigen ligase [uncultured Phascolarctobacterium sp.]|uniref:O-antigen ligase family protein n=1 Tax=uncultured Phascolarctobacterium sp. TaxID=512296 RepID=UPI0025E70476|nr:O-antigen ligase family protein [uncultured Phascolarctobacterium sp.]